jgi:hypothetical protein
MNSPEFRPDRSLERRRQQLFTKGAARLIAHGQVEAARLTVERAVGEDREPLVFSHEVPLEIVAEGIGHDEMLVDASLSLTEARIDPGGDPDPLPASLLLSVQKINNTGNLIEEEYFISLETSALGHEYTGSYLHSSSGGHALEDIFDDKYVRDLTEDDLTRLETALNSLPPAPSMERHRHHNS